MELVHRMNGKQEKETVVYSPDAVKLVRPGETFVLRYADRTLFVYDDVKRTAREVSLDQYLAEAKEKTALPDLPDLVQSFGGGAFQMEATNQEAEFGGVQGKLTRITAGTIHVELVLAEALEPPGPRQPTFEFLQAIGGVLAIPAPLFEQVRGFPIRSIVRVQSAGFPEVKVARSLLSVEKGKIEAEEFAAPEGYATTKG